MHWSSYEVFSVLSGAILIIGSMIAPAMKAKDRFWCFAGGLVFIGLAVWSGRATSGTFYFPVQIFIIPPAAVIWLLVKFFSAGSRKTTVPTPLRVASTLSPSAPSATPSAEYRVCVTSSCDDSGRPTSTDYCTRCGNLTQPSGRHAAIGP